MSVRAAEVWSHIRSDRRRGRNRGRERIAGATTLTLLLALLLLGLPFQVLGPTEVSAAQPPASEACGDRPLHTPIEIHGDVGPQGFLLGHDPLSGAPIMRPGTGVTSGTGTQEDPYIIEGHCLLGPGMGLTSSFWGIALLHTDAHVIIRDNAVLSFDQGIFVHAASHIILEGNDARGSAINILVETSDDIIVRANHVAGGTIGITVGETERALVADNVVHDTTGGAGISLRDALDSQARGNEVFGIPASTHGAIKVTGGARNGVIENHLHDNAVAGILVEHTTDATVADNLVVRNRDGIATHGTRHAIISHNTVHGNARNGIDLDSWSGSNEVSDNDVRDSGSVGIRANEHPFDPHGTLVAFGNNLVGNRDAGVEASCCAAIVDARHNWWGCPAGPTHPACDGVTGSVVLYEPWLSAPDPDAGVR